MGDSKTSNDGRSCFVICPIGAAGSEIRDRADQIFDLAIEPAVKDCGFLAKRADMESMPGIVTTQIICDIRDAEMIVADLTGPNPNVMYELGVAHALDKRIVTIIDENHVLPFDTAPQRAIKFRYDARGLGRLQSDITGAMKAAEAGKGGTDSPVKAAQAITALRTSEDPNSAILAGISDRLSALEGATGAFGAGVSERYYAVDARTGKHYPTVDVSQPSKTEVVLLKKIGFAASSRAPEEPSE